MNKDCQYPPDSGSAGLEALDRESLERLVRQLHRRLNKDNSQENTPAAAVPSLVLDNTGIQQQSAFTTPIHSSFPLAFFLDPEFFVSVPHFSLGSTSPIPQHIVDCIKDCIPVICDQYFSTIGSWFPFLHRTRLSQSLAVVSTPHGSIDADLAAKIVCMKLLSNPAEGEAQGKHSTYSSAKHFIGKLESSSHVSLDLLQSIVMVALYETCHGIYPAAYLTTSHAVRVGNLMGIHCRKYTTQLFKPADTWSLREEERRTWWAIMILERHAIPNPAQTYN